MKRSRLPLDVLDVANQLDAEVGLSRDEVAVSVNTDLDESFLIGTRAAFIRLAAALLRVTANKAPPQLNDGIECRWSNYTHDVSYNMAQVVIHAECLVATDEERKQLADFFRVLAGD